MNLTKLIDLKERIAISEAFTPDERDFLLDAINTRVALAAAPAGVAVAHSPPNYLGRIDHIFAVLSVDDGGEGVVAAPLGGALLPLIAADKKRLDQIIPIARALAPIFGKVLRLAKFRSREDIDLYRPE